MTVYYTHRTTSKSSVYNESTSSCPGATGTTLTLEIVKEDTIFGTLSTVASKTASGGNPFSGEAEYLCPTGNTSGFQAVTYSSITYGGQVLYAEAYDGAPGGGYYRYSCG
ncbi:hypothetical protein [Curtobacterium ammoniigenes]|uniref:hypothetical protein n=1 Tax=Curtobacterium ammoniigenes TaxID=395387 RepID=UPI00082E7077|nr:hypothetical protein [Curtobacterium ammoniigenes]